MSELCAHVASVKIVSESKTSKTELREEARERARIFWCGGDVIFA